MSVNLPAVSDPVIAASGMYFKYRGHLYRILRTRLADGSLFVENCETLLQLHLESDFVLTEDLLVKVVRE
jgi:hypothetical protein